MLYVEPEWLSRTGLLPEGSQKGGRDRCATDEM